MTYSRLPVSVQRHVDKARDAHNAPPEVNGRTAFVCRFDQPDGRTYYGVNYLGQDKGRVGCKYETDHTPKDKVTVIAPVVPTDQEIQDRMMCGNLGGGDFFADCTRERDGDYVRLAFLPNNSEVLEVERVYIPRWLMQEIQEHAEVLRTARRKKAEHDAELTRRGQEWAKQHGY